MPRFAFAALMIALTFISGVSIGCSTTEPSPQPAPASSGGLTSLSKDGKVTPEFAYASGLRWGRMVGERLKEDSLKADDDLILQGVRDGLNGNKPRYPEAQMEKAIDQIDNLVALHRAEKKYASDPAFKKMADENLARGREVLDREAKMTGVEKLKSGLLVKTVKPGTGAVIGGATSVNATFELALVDGTVVKASEKDKPSKTTLAKLPPAVADALRDLQVGGQYRIMVPAELAYGLAGREPIVGPNQALSLEFVIVSAE